MQHPRPIPSFRQFPDPDHFHDLERLGEEITQLAAHIHAATFQLLELIREFDEQEGWSGEGVNSCAHWLNWKCGMNQGAAREKVRVAHALPELPLISSAFREGRVSYSKVRAMTRVATPKNEADLLSIAQHGTAAHVERLVSQYRRLQRDETLEAENIRHAQRELSWTMDSDGMWLFRGKFTAEQGALIAHALESAMDQMFHESENEPDDVSAETPAGVDGCLAVPHPVATRRADALERVAEAWLAKPCGDRSGGDRYLLHIHTDVETLKSGGEGPESELEGHGCVSAETSRRMACDAAVVHWHETSEGEALNIGRKSRSIPPATRRALQRRDGGCRFPGCTCTRFVDAHHIQHWADGGETNMDNLVLLCRRHHRLVHEGGFGVSRNRAGAIEFTYPGGRPMAAGPDRRFRGNVVSITAGNRGRGLDITPKTLPPRWLGEVMDYSMAVTVLQSSELSPRLEEQDVAWLRQATRPLEEMPSSPG
ncbi:MAG: HNH endonuclease [Gammaproteobacteria bacterium]|nr:HNH endonuclease [Gammaproteobacteria bacterium]